MVEPLSVAWHAVKRSAFKPGDKCLIMGSGPVCGVAWRHVAMTQKVSLDRFDGPQGPSVRAFVPQS